MMMMRLLPAVALSFLLGKGMCADDSTTWWRRSLHYLSFPAIVVPPQAPDSHCLRFDAKSDPAMELHRISETGWKDISETAYIQQSFLITNNGTKDICGYEFYIPLSSEMDVYSSYSIVLSRSSEMATNSTRAAAKSTQRDYSFRGVFPDFMERLAPNETFTFGYILAGERATPDGRSSTRPIPCISAIKVCSKAGEAGEDRRQ